MAEGGESERPEIDTSVPHSARIWNYWLGGKDNFPVDRAAGDQFLQVFPGMAQAAQASRGFLMRSVRFIAEAGIRQFLDVGTGLPTVDNTHEVAQRVAPESVIVYVDNDPLVLAHARALLTSTAEGRTAYVHADARDPENVLRRAAENIDFARPVGLILSGIMGHIVDDDQARWIVRKFVDALAPGSHLSLNDGTNVLSAANVEAHERYNASGAAPYKQRSPEQLARFFDGLELVEPGLVMVSRWRVDPGRFGEAPEVDGYCAVGRKP
ncbi:SAM-dependent methyltransferase [Actinomadura syzygii]|uniref:SAM-dependent methyltransferase n=1 Tax=Actinomadura syzygii TaxID=1427538 RepID=A0A5D0U0D4_9ACTN|nr:SAM-dependent methyltransferase [Actinomadura syzygii]TYC11517.1 SAM-dependent methyltransferase [Actinomadura syzygii]